MTYPTEDHRIWLILPLSYKTDFVTSCNCLLQNGWQEENLKTTQLFFHIRSLISTERRNERVGGYFLLQDRAKYGLHSDRHTEYYCHYTANGEDFRVSFYFHNISLILFETQTAFLSFEVKLTKNHTLENLILAGYYLKKFHDRKIAISSEKLSQAPQPFQDLAQRLLEPLDIDSYFETEEKSPSQAFVYSAAILSADSFKAMGNRELGRVMFELRRSFKKSYKPAPKEFDLENNPDVLRLFDNIY